MATSDRTTGTRDEHYNVISVLYHALQGADTCATLSPGRRARRRPGPGPVLSGGPGHVPAAGRPGQDVPAATAPLGARPSEASRLTGRRLPIKRPRSGPPRPKRRGINGSGGPSCGCGPSPVGRSSMGQSIGADDGCLPAGAGCLDAIDRRRMDKTAPMRTEEGPRCTHSCCAHVQCAVAVSHHD